MAYKSKKDKIAWQRKNRKKSDPEKQREYRLKTKFGMTIAQYDELLELQGHFCAICLRPQTTNRKLAVDHDHETGAIRGLLCHKCNLTLGQMDDSILLLERAINYLKEYNEKAS